MRMMLSNGYVFGFCHVKFSNEFLWLNVFLNAYGFRRSCRRKCKFGSLREGQDIKEEIYVKGS